LEIENLSDQFDLYAQAGDVVKGGRQDRTLGVDFVLPVKSGRVPIPSFCVESGRWRRRAGEDVHSFSSSKSSLASKKLRMAMKFKMSQAAVWDEVAQMQSKLSESLKERIESDLSPTSYQLAVEHTDVQKSKETYRSTLGSIIDEVPDAVGYAFVINGVLNTADIYGSRVLFRRLWSKLLDATVLEAIAESGRPVATTNPPVTADAIREWFRESDTSEVANRQEVPPRVRVDTRRSQKSVLFDTCDHGLNDAVLHRNLVTT
jgi:hypothetical protein